MSSSHASDVTPPAAAAESSVLAWATLGAVAALWVCTLGPVYQAITAGVLAFAVFTWWTLRRAGRWVTVLLVALLCLPPLPFALGNSGPHPGLALAALGVAEGVLRANEWTGVLPRTALYLLLLPLVLLLSIPLAAYYSGPVLASESLARALLFTISIYIFFYVASRPADSAPHSGTTARALYAVGVFSAVFALFDFFYQLPTPAGYGEQFVWLSRGVFRRAQGLFYEASTLGNVCVFFLTGAAVALTERGNRILGSRPWTMLGAAAFIAALLFSFSRGSLAALGVSLSALLWIRRRSVYWTRLGATLGACFGGALMLVYLLSPVMVEFYWLRLKISVEQLVAGNTQVLSGRAANWTYLTDFLIQHPWHSLLGIGYKTLPYSDFIGRPVVADNAYLSALVETGILGLAALFLFHAAVFSIALQAIRSANSAARFYGAWIGCFWFGEAAQMMSGDLLTYWRVLPVYFWVLAMAVRSSRSPHST